MMTRTDPRQSAAGIPEMTGLTADSREVRPGYLFAALPGTRVDGRSFIGDAIGLGARTILAPPGTVLPPGAEGVDLIVDDNPRSRFAHLAAAFYRDQPATIAAITSTNGKTSTASFTRQIWQALGLKAASIGTLGIAAPGFERKGALTTPDPVALHASLADLAAAGIDHLAMEASSHGLAQYRLDGVRVTIAGFINLSRDHLDYHGTMEKYLAAKARLFAEVLVEDGTAVLNADAPECAGLAALAAAGGRRVMTYGAAGRDIVLIAAEPLANGLDLTIEIGGTRHRVEVPLVGTFQAQNILCALGMVLAEPGIDAAAAIASLERLEGVRGRLEQVARLAHGAPIFVDYAHTPDALATVLDALRPHTRGSLFVVFGCGGDRDRGKRPQMGAIAQKLADRVVVTDDNPRGENPADIRSEIMPACPDAVEIGDRAEAIAFAVRSLGPEDVLVVAGKGHESGQIVGDTVLPFDDATVVRAAVAAQDGGTP